jgi:hypothetical protein
MASVKYNFKIALLDLDDSKVVEDGNEVLLSSLLANNIRNSPITEDIVVKMFGWAVDLKKTGELALDEDDKTKLQKFILSNNNFPAITKGRLYEVLNKPEKSAK